MRIRKQYQVIPTNALLENGYSTSDKNGYTCDYLNSKIETKKISITLNDASSANYNENYVIGNEVQIAGDFRATIPSGSYSQVKLFTIPSQYKPIIDAATDASIRFPMIANNGAFGYAYINQDGEVYAQIPSNPSSANAVYINIRYRYK